MNSIRDYKPKNYGEKRDYNKNKKKRKKRSVQKINIIQHIR